GLQDWMVKDVRPVLYLMWGGSLFVLLIGCVNVANLVLVRSRVRLKELATRLSLGAGAWRLARQLVVEHLVLALGASAAGIAIGYAALRALNAIDLETLPRSQDISLDAIVVVYTVVAAAAIGAALLFATFRKVLAVDPGFVTTGVLTAEVSLPYGRYRDGAAVRRFTDEALRRLRGLPGVSIGGATNSLPLGNNASADAILAEGYAPRKGESLIAPSASAVSPGYFEAIGAKLVAGRVFNDRDTESAPRVIIIDDRLARRFWPNQDPIGRRMYKPGDTT